MTHVEIMNVISWTKPFKSACYLVALNVCLWFIQCQRPVFVVSVATLIYYLRYLWKHRIQKEILVDPNDDEDWSDIHWYDVERSVIEFYKSVLKGWFALRKDNYYLWIILTSIFWIFMAKLATHVSFVKFLVIILNGSFLLGPTLKTIPTEFLESSMDTGTNPGVSVSSINPSQHEIRRTSEYLQRQQQTPPQQQQQNVNLKDTVLSTIMSAISSSTSSLRSISSTSTTASNPNQTTNTNTRKMPDEFLFDAKHFEESSSSSSSSSPNSPQNSKSSSFELINNM